MINLENKTVLVTGGLGMLGKAICPILINRGAHICTFSSKQFDLRNWVEAREVFMKVQPDFCLNLCGKNGGMTHNQENPAVIFRDNTLMGLNILEAARQAGVKKTISTLTSCAYPGNSPEVLQEKDFWNGQNHPTVECHGLAKRTIEAYSRFLNQQYAHDKLPANFLTVSLTNLFGPNDNYTTSGKVVSNLIRKFVQAKHDNLDKVVCLGTGIALRDLLYVDDAAELVVRALERYENKELPLNIGSGSEVSIKELAETIKKIVGFEGEIIWDNNYSDGQLRKLLDTTRMKEILDYVPKVSLKEGLEKTIDWYIKNQQQVSPSYSESKQGKSYQ